MNYRVNCFILCDLLYINGIKFNSDFIKVITCLLKSKILLSNRTLEWHQVVCY